MNKTPIKVRNRVINNETIRGYISKVFEPSFHKKRNSQIIEDPNIDNKEHLIFPSITNRIQENDNLLSPERVEGAETMITATNPQV